MPWVREEEARESERAWNYTGIRPGRGRSGEELEERHPLSRETERVRVTREYKVSHS